MKKVLVIEDNEDVCENTVEILTFADYKAITAKNGKIGIEIAEQQLPDVILCDIMMPELDGFEVLKILSENSKTSHIPFIFLTAKSEKADIRKGMNLGADDYLTKPFTEKELLNAIKSRLKRHEFLKKEFSKTIAGVSQFIEEASNYLDLDHLSRDYSPQKYNKREVLYMEGNKANYLYFIQSGAIKTYKTTEKGKDFVTGLFSAGQFVGYLSLLSNNGSYIESASILENAVLYKIPKSDFINLIHSNKDVANKFVNLISNNLVDVQEQMVNVAYASVRQRVAKALLDIHKKRILCNNGDNGISIDREDFASLIGTATETAIRMLTKFKDEGFITIGAGRKIQIENSKALEDIVHFN